MKKYLVSSRSIAIIGTGKIRRDNDKEGWAVGHKHAAGYRAADPKIRILGVAPKEEQRRAFGEKFGVASFDLFASTEALYQKIVPDFVSVCTWPEHHLAQVKEAAARGVKGILCEKPVGLSRAEMDEMEAAVRKSGSVLAVAHQRRYKQNISLVKEILASGKIGGGWVLEARVRDDWDMLSWTSHWFDLANYLFGGPAEWILAGMHAGLTERFGHPAETSSVAIAQYPGGEQGIFVTGPPNPQPHELLIRGEKGFLRVGVDHRVEVFSETGYEIREADANAPAGFHALALDLFDAVEKGKKIRCDYRESKYGTLMAFAAQESARTQKKIFISETPSYAPLSLLEKGR